MQLGRQRAAPAVAPPSLHPEMLCELFCCCYSSGHHLRDANRAAEARVCHKYIRDPPPRARGIIRNKVPEVYVIGDLPLAINTHPPPRHGWLSCKSHPLCFRSMNPKAPLLHLPSPTRFEVGQGSGMIGWRSSKTPTRRGRRRLSLSNCANKVLPSV